MNKIISICNFDIIWGSDEIKEFNKTYKTKSKFSGEIIDNYLLKIYKFKSTEDSLVYVTTNESTLSLFMLKFPECISKIIPYE